MRCVGFLMPVKAGETRGRWLNPFKRLSAFRLVICAFFFAIVRQVVLK
jgi:hypothetical protein